MRKLSLFLVVVIVALLVVPGSVQAEDDSGNPFFGMGIFLLTGGWDCDEPDSEEPFAAIQVDKKEGKAPLKVKFDGANSHDPDGNIEKYEWDFGTGSGVTGSSVTHTYSSPGSYEATLTVTDNDGYSDEDKVQIEVEAKPEPNQPPNASFSANPTNGTVPLQVNFNASNSSDPDGNIRNYSWDFGDGTTGSGKTATHTFNSAGNYTVELKITDNDNATDTTTRTVSVNEQSNQAPTASFNANPTSGTVPLQVDFDASASSDPDGSIVSYSWDYDTGATDSGISNSYTFNSADTYTVELRVRDDDGATDTATTSVEATDSEPEDKDVILSLAQGRPVSYGEWFRLKIDGYGTNGTVDILHNGNVNHVTWQTLSSWQVTVSEPSTNRISIEFWNGNDANAIRGIVKMKMSGSGRSQLELTNAVVYSGNYEMNIQRLIGTTIE